MGMARWVEVGCFVEGHFVVFLNMFDGLLGAAWLVGAF